MDNIKMGLKHVILQRVQSDDSNDSNVEPKKITDFSIKRILSNEVSKADRNYEAKKCKSDILDLSKGSDLTNRSVYYHPKLLSSVSDNHFKGSYFHPLNYPIAGGYSDSIIIRPKVCKFWSPNAMNNLINNSDCNDCSVYYQNVESHKYPYYKNNNTLKGSYLDSTNVLFEKYFVKSSSISVNLNASSTSQLMRKETAHRPLQGIIENESSFRCSVCDKVFGCSTTLMSHEKTHKSPRYECLDCGKGFSQLRNYKYHLSVHRGTKEFAAKCPECGKTFNDKGYLSSHMKIHRNKKEYECPYCPKSFNQRVAFNMHVRIHTGVKPHKCVECGKRFSRKMLLKQHMRTHSGEKPYQCSVCGKSFADRSNMTLHHRLHSGIKPFNCPICPKAFTKKHHLKTHLNYHTGCKPYICPHPNCKQAFTQSSNMRTHAKKCQFKPSGNSPQISNSNHLCPEGFLPTSSISSLHSGFLPQMNMSL